MTKLNGLVRQAALVLSAMVVSVGASAAVTWTIDGGKVTGANNVSVNGSYYDVVFGDAYVAPTSVMTESFAFAAAQALLDQVFVAAAPLSLDSTPTALAGCEYSIACLVSVPYASGVGTSGSYVDSHTAANWDDIVTVDSLWFNKPRHFLVQFSYGDLTGSSWSAATVPASPVPPVTAVPEPETYALMLAGLGLMGAVARRRQIKHA